VRSVRPAAEQDLIPGVVEWGDVDWDRAKRVRYHVWQRFTYRYPAPVTQVDQRLVVLPPRISASSRRLAHAFRMDAEGTVDESEDRFGNAVLKIQVPRVDEQVSFETHFVVEQDRPAAHASTEGLPDDGTLLAATPRTEAGPLVSRLAEGAATTTGGAVARARAICTAVRGAMAYRHEVTDVQTTAEEALAVGAGVCQDFAHVMVAACRHLGVAARYVSGHLVGEGGTHAWVEVAGGREFPGFWGFDPTHDRAVGLSYVAVAAGRDYADVAPTSGTYHGPPGGVLDSARRVAICGVVYPRR
jgi:transglutaminase-like putative cysteine protease